jgi:catechol 2,3-dioxygenase-like lactoylglutathione lyase family enzyme
VPKKKMIRRIWDVTLTVSDLRRAMDFYGGVLGLSKKYEYRDYSGFDCGGIEIGLKTWGELEKPRKGEPNLDFLVDDINDAYLILSRKGVIFLNESKDTQWGSKAATFADPDGNILQITQIDWQRYFMVSAKTLDS